MTLIHKVVFLCVRSAAMLVLTLPAAFSAQSIQPIISEYTGQAEGKFLVTNDTLSAMAVVLDPKSFSIREDGRGVFRSLDSTVHLALSASSFRLAPKQSFYVFYKAKVEAMPAWFTIYAAFTPLNSGTGMKVRILLPHTVYLYQKRQAEQKDFVLSQAAFDASKGTVSFDLDNSGSALVRVQAVHASVGKADVTAAGFPLLPGARRHVEFAWDKEGHPDEVLIQFPHFDMEQPLSDKVQ